MDLRKGNASNEELRLTYPRNVPSEHSIRTTQGFTKAGKPYRRVKRPLWQQLHSQPSAKFEAEARRQAIIRHKLHSEEALKPEFTAVTVEEPEISQQSIVGMQPTIKTLPDSVKPPQALHSTVKVLILGAGPTGLGAAHQLEAQKCHDWVLLDSQNRPGGMAVTEVDQYGFRWDLGGHVIHSHYKSFDKAALLHTDWAQPNRGGWVRVDGQWCPTPIQQSLGNLRQGKKITRELRGKGRGAAKPDAKSNSLAQYYRNRFGETLNDTFFTPFNRKQWAWDLNQLDHTWTSLRSGSAAANVPPPSATLVHLDEPLDTSSFPYPRLGTGSLWKSIASALPQAKQRYQATITRLDLHQKRAHLSDGSTVTFSRCISTIPLNAMLELVGHQRPDLKKIAPTLRHSSTTVIGLGFLGELPEVLKNKTWIFSADADVDFHRATVVTNFSPSLSNGGDDGGWGPRWSIMFETASSPLRDINIQPAHLVKRHLEELRRWGAIEAGHTPLSVWHKHLHMGYPLPFLGRDELLSSSQNKILAELEKYGVVSRGRFGGWRYESSNQDCAFEQGIQAVDLVLKGKEETEFWAARPDKVKLIPLDDDEDDDQVPILAEKQKVKPAKMGFFETIKTYIQANYFVVDASPEIVLPEAPTEEEKMSFTQTHRAFVVLMGIFAFLSSSAGLWLFSISGPAFYWFGACCALSQVTTFIFLLSSALGHKFDMKKHQELKDEHGIYASEKADVPTVDLYLPCCKEPLEVLENTYGYVKEMVYPKGKLQVHVLDDGGMQEVKELADRFGFNYICREERGQLKKAGNLRNAYAKTTGDYFAIFDADFCPRHDFLLETIPMMKADEKLAVIQTPQYFRTTGALGGQTWVERGAGAVQELFYRLIMTSRDTWGGAICAGSCALYRREALKKLGGTAPLESSEDIWTGFHLIQDGWKVNYLPLVLSCGNCPDTARALFSQQIRWCEGSCSLVLSKAFWKSNFTIKQKMLYFSGLLYYLDQALTPFILPLPSIFLVWLRVNRLLYYNLAFAVPTLLYSYWLCRFWSRAKHAKSVSMVNPIQSYAYATAFKDRLFGSKYVWVPSGDAKSHKSNRYRNSRFVCIGWTFATTAALATGIVVRWIGGHPWYDFLPIIALQAYSIHNLLPFMFAA